MSGWRNIMNKYLDDMDSKTVATLELIVANLSKSGQAFDSRIKDHFMKSLINRLEQVVEYFEIQNSPSVQQLAQNPIESRSEPSGVSNESKTSAPLEIKSETMSSDDVQVIENVESVDEISTSFQIGDEIEDVAEFEARIDAEINAEIKAEFVETQNELEIAEKLRHRINKRSSLDSCASSVDRRSMCSPSTSNMPVTPRFDSFMTQSEILSFTMPSNEIAQCAMTTQFKDWDSMAVIKQEVEIESNFSDTTVKNEILCGTQTRPAKRPNESEDEIPAKIHKINVNELAAVSNDPAVNHQIPCPGNRMMKFLCYHCFRIAECDLKEKRIPLRYDYFDDIEIVKAHWKAHHASKQFQFFAIAVAACFHCNKIDSFQNLRNHHKQFHSADTFVVVDQQNPSKCGLCQKIFSATEMVDHFKANHNRESTAYMLSPTCFTQSEIDWLLQINLNANAEATKEIVSFVCGQCIQTKNVTEWTLEKHFEEKRFPFRCLQSNCKTVTDDISELINHEVYIHKSTDFYVKYTDDLRVRMRRYIYRTKLIFFNGLVVFKHNLLRTSLDDSDNFFKFIDRLVEEKFKLHSNPTEEPKSGHFRGNRVENGDDFKNNQLMKQNKYKNHIYISWVGGIPKNVDNNYCMEIFSTICGSLDVNISVDDVASIFPGTKQYIVVKLKKYYMKRLILKKWDTARMSSEFHGRLVETMKMQRRLDVKKLRIDVYLTPFFKRLQTQAKTAKRNNQIHSFWVSEHGFNVIIDAMSEPKTVWSKLDLINLINSN